MKKCSFCIIGIAALILMVVVVPSEGVFFNCPGCPMTGTSPPWRSPDLNSDSTVGIIDFSMFAQYYFPKPYWKCCDFDNDGLVNIVDFSIFAMHFMHAGPHGAGLCT